MGAALGDLAADLSLASPKDPYEFNPVAWLLQTPQEARALCWFDLCAACGARGLNDDDDEEGRGLFDDNSIDRSDCRGENKSSTHRHNSKVSKDPLRQEDGQLLFCADCGEGFHPFCLPMSLPLATMDPVTRLGWRCVPVLFTLHVYYISVVWTSQRMNIRGCA